MYFKTPIGNCYTIVFQSI